jgi:threonyl-tRNA synthetase
MAHTEALGEAAFYGPKIDFIVRDVLGREWQLGTIQVDYNLPERFALDYAGADNTPHRPVMVHRAPFGSLERFVGILIEHYAGAFPVWLSPRQIAVLPVSDKFNEYGRGVLGALRTAGIRADLDDSPEKIGAKIRRATLEKTPYMGVVGQREQDSGQVSIRHRTLGDCGSVSLERLLAGLKQEIAAKSTGGSVFQAPQAAANV